MYVTLSGYERWAFISILYFIIQKPKMTNPLTLRLGDLYATRLWFYSNLSCVLTISLFGKIIGCSCYFNFLVGYSTAELFTIDINEILKFNSFGKFALFNLLSVKLYLLLLSSQIFTFHKGVVVIINILG